MSKSTGSILAACVLVSPLMAWAETPVERGEYLVRGPMGCGNCHTPQGPEGPDMSMELAGGQLVIDDATMKAWSANITPGGEIAGWSDADLARAIREGIRPDGTLIGPPMPFTFYRHLSDTDLAAIVAFLRTLEPIENDVAEIGLQLPAAAGLGAAGGACRGNPARADRGIRRLYGRAGRALPRMPHADRAAGADDRHRPRAGRFRVSRTLGRCRFRRTSPRARMGWRITPTTRSRR